MKKGSSPQDMITTDTPSRISPSRTYHFRRVLACNMCGCPSDAAKTLGLRLNISHGIQPRKKTGIAVSVCKCYKCGLIFPQPLPIPQNISDHYGMEPEAYWSTGYFCNDSRYFQKQISDAKRLLKFKDGMRALDIGVGIGKAMRALIDAGFDTYGIEPSEPFLARAISSGLPPHRLQLTAIEDAAFQRGFFDFITFGAVLEHLSDPASAIERALHWLSPGGIIHVEVPSSDYLISKLLNLYYLCNLTNYVTNLSPMHPPYHLYEFHTNSFVMHGNKVGYIVIHSYHEIGTIQHIPQILHFPLRRWMSFRQSGMQLTVWLRNMRDIG